MPSGNPTTHPKNIPDFFRQFPVPYIAMSDVRTRRIYWPSVATCRWCKKKFAYVPSQDAPIRLFCSRKCYFAFRQASADTWESRTCKGCSKAFMFHGERFGSSGIFCSRGCCFSYRHRSALQEFMKRFQNYVDKNGPIHPVLGTRCWLWVGVINKGQGEIRLFGRSRRVHRIAWEIYHGRPIPAGMLIRHICDVGNCVNPEHLIVGTHADNMRDTVIRVKSRFGERNAMAKLTENQAIEIIRLRHAGLKLRDIALRLHIPIPAVSGVAGGRRWRHLPRPVGLVVRSQRPVSSSQVRKAFILYAQGLTFEKIAKKLGMGIRSVGKIISRETHQEVIPPCRVKVRSVRKLTDSRARSTFRLYGEGLSYSEVARRLGVTVAVVGGIIRRETYPHISPPLAVIPRSSQKLDQSSAKEIVRLRRAALSLSTIGKRVGVSMSTVHRVLIGESWAKVSGFSNRRVLGGRSAERSN